MLSVQTDHAAQAHAALATPVDLYRTRELTFGLSETERARVQVEER
jgi:hypothetical protein